VAAGTTASEKANGRRRRHCSVVHRELLPGSDTLIPKCYAFCAVSVTYRPVMLAAPSAGIQKFNGVVADNLEALPAISI